MNKFRLATPSDMLDVDNKVLLTADINHAMIEYGLMVRAEFLKWMVYGDDYSNLEMEDLLMRVIRNFAMESDLPVNLNNDLSLSVERYLNNLPQRKRMGLSFILFNSHDFIESVKDNLDSANLSHSELKAFVGREVEKEIYVGGSYDLETKIKHYLIHHVCRFAAEFRFVSGVISQKRINELLDIYSRNTIAAMEI